MIKQKIFKYSIYYKKILFFLIFFSIFFYVWQLNSSIPLQSGDDYDFLITSQEGGIINVFYEYIELYNNWNGRPGNLYAMLFLQDSKKDVFNIISSLFFMLFIIGIFTLALARLPSPKKLFDIILVLFIFLLIFFFHEQNDIRTTIFWQTGASNYLIPHTILLWVLIPFRFLLSSKVLLPNTIFSALLIFLTGLIGGWTNETTFPGAFLLLLSVFIIYRFKYTCTLPSWFYSGALGLLFGWLFIILSPGHSHRLAIKLEKSNSLLMWLQHSHLERIYMSLLKNIEYFFEFRSMMWIFGVPLLIYSFKKSREFLSQKEKVFKPEIFFLLSLVMMFISDWSYIYAMGKPKYTKAVFSGFAFFLMGFVSLAANFEWNRSKVLMRSIIVGIVLYLSFFSLIISYKLIDVASIVKNQYEKRMEVIKQSKGKDLVLEPYMLIAYNILLRDHLAFNAEDQIYNYRDHYYSTIHGLKSVRIAPPIREYSMAKKIFISDFDIGKKNIITEASIFSDKDNHILFIRLRNNKIKGNIQVNNVYKYSLFFLPFAEKLELSAINAAKLLFKVPPFGVSNISDSQRFVDKEGIVYFTSLTKSPENLLIYSYNKKVNIDNILIIDTF